MSFQRRIGLLLMGGLLVIVACNLPQATVTPGAGGGRGTAISPAALTMAALNQTAIAQPLPPSEEIPAPPSASPTASLTPTVTLTPTPSTPMVSVSVNTNCRTGPGDAYNRVGGLLVGETAKVLARDPYGQFWYIPNPDQPGSYCWIWGHYATVTGETASLPVFTPPPTPTPSADFAILGISKVICGSQAGYSVKVRNTGGIIWRSFRVSEVDVITNAVVTKTGSYFPDHHACIVNVLPFPTLPAGREGYLVGFFDTPGQRRRFIITLYTGDGQSGQAITRTAEYTLP